MLEADLVSSAAPLGVAGLVAWMWLLERRGAVDREWQLSASHDRILEQRVQLEALIELVRENVRAVSSLEASQRSMARAIERLADGPERAGAEAPAPASGVGGA